MSAAGVPRRCPFCASTSVRVLDLRGIVGDLTVECQGCGACGPGAKDAAGAIAAWNGPSGRGAGPGGAELVRLGTMAEDMRGELVAAGAQAVVTAVFAGGFGVVGYQGDAGLEREKMERAIEAAVARCFDDIAAGRAQRFRPGVPAIARPM